MSARRRKAPAKKPAPRPGANVEGLTVREYLRRLSMDPAYLAAKAEVGEPLSPAEREVLEAARAGSAPGPAGGGS